MENDFKTPDDVTEFESKIAKSAGQIPDSDKKKLEKAIEEKNQTNLSMSDRYKLAWNKIYKSLPIWRQKEIDTQLKTGTLSNKDWDNDFVQRVAAEAERDPQAV